MIGADAPIYPARVRPSVFGINSNDPNPKFKTEAFGDLGLDIVSHLVLSVWYLSRVSVRPQT